MFRVRKKIRSESVTWCKNNDEKHVLVGQKKEEEIMLGVIMTRDR